MIQFSCYIQIKNVQYFNIISLLTGHKHLIIFVNKNLLFFFIRFILFLLHLHQADHYLKYHTRLAILSIYESIFNNIRKSFSLGSFKLIDIRFLLRSLMSFVIHEFLSQYNGEKKSSNLMKCELLIIALFCW